MREGVVSELERWPPPIESPPRGEDLPWDDGEPMESQRHVKQAELLDSALALGRPDLYVGRNMFFYFSAAQARKNDFRGPDVFVVRGVERRERKSWVVWEEEGRVPDVVIEITSASTRTEDRVRKKKVYESLHVGEYFLYDPFTHELLGYRLSRGRYVPIRPLQPGRLPSAALDLGLGLHPAPFQGFEGPWLRWYGPDGEVLPIPEEQARAAEEQARAAAEQARVAEEQARAAERRAAELAERVRAYEARFG
jgi:Uma2 family endonuclease